jgi:hypothetical protein
MATMANPAPGATVVGDANESDPFISSTTSDSQRHRYSAFDSQLFSLYADGSPSQTKRALEAHLAETERRLQEASHLGTVLVQQRKELADRLKDVEQQQEQSEIGPELRKRLSEVEREFNDVGAITARNFLPRSRVSSGESTVESALSGSVLSTEGRQSPSKPSFPQSRKQRNQGPSRVNDIQLATDISTSLLQQLRDLQAVLAEKDEQLKNVNLEKSQLEVEVEGLGQRLRALDESEQRYKDENWSLETQLHELSAASRDSSEREQRLLQANNAAQAEKDALERDLEELKQAHGKLSEEHAANKKHFDAELATLKRNVTVGETEKGALLRKIDELSSQNGELAKAVSHRIRSEEYASARETASESEGPEGDNVTPEHSPPPSPNKATPRHGHLETETLRSSLQHAQRMIQNLRSNIHREKTEKIELRRMLADARDELEMRRGENNLANSAGKKRRNGKDQDVFKKPARPDRLGGARSSKDEIILDDEWEDHEGPATPSKMPSAQPRGGVTGGRSSVIDTSTDAFETATENSDAFETATERETTDAFHTGAENMDDSSDDLTETESGARPTSIRRSRPSPGPTGEDASKRLSFLSTASTSDEDDDGLDVRTPVQAQHPRYRLRINRGGQRRSARGSQMYSESNENTPDAKGSPASYRSYGSPAPAGQSLFAELDGLGEDGSDNESNVTGTPSRSATVSREASPEISRKRPSFEAFPAVLQQPKPEMMDSGVMTEAWEPEPKIVTKTVEVQVEKPKPEVPLVLSTITSQSTTPEEPPKPLPPTLEIAAITHSDTAPVAPEEKLPPPMQVVDISSQETEPVEPPTPVAPLPPQMQFVTGSTLETSPVEPSKVEVAPPALQFASVASQDTEPVEPIKRESTSLPSLQIATVASQDTEPVDSVQRESTPLPSLQIATVASQDTEPVEPAKRELPLPPSLQIASVSSLDTEPIEPAKSEPPSPPALEFVSGSTLETSPIEPPKLELPVPPTLSLSAVTAQELEPIAVPAKEPEPEPVPIAVEPVVTPPSLDFSTFIHCDTEPIESEPTDKRKSSGIFGSVFGWNKTAQDESSVAEDVENENVSRGKAESSPERVPFQALDANAVHRGPADQTKSRDPVKLPIITTDEGTQTSISAEEIERALNAQDRPASLNLRSPPKPGSSHSSPKKALGLSDPPIKSPRRPGSSSSMRSFADPPPPLPSNHKEQIAAAMQRDSQVPTPTGQGSMGPPLMPASAYRNSGSLRPRTPSINSQVEATPNSKSGTTPRPRPQTQRSNISTPVTRRSSVSSFASELDQRFNIARPAMGPGGFDTSTITDPRMIQAITQTMIGEWLWKYTRKTGRAEHSERRHRRFFWVHPYNRMLYWADYDISNHERAEARSKGVPIEAVHVVTDDNNDPPGLHRKSLVIVTPGRQIKVTAPTGQRHETWFNALSYLLLKPSDDGEYGDGITAEDVDEFNPSTYGRSVSRTTGRSRVSLSSYNSRTTRASSPSRHQIPTLTRRTVSSQRASVQPRPAQGSASSRLSSMFKPASMMGSLSSRRSRVEPKEAQIYEAPVVRDSAEDIRQVIEKQDMESDRLENVRACCDGMSRANCLIFSR